MNLKNRIATSFTTATSAVIATLIEFNVIEWTDEQTARVGVLAGRIAFVAFGYDQRNETE